VNTHNTSTERQTKTRWVDATRLCSAEREVSSYSLHPKGKSEYSAIRYSYISCTCTAIYDSPFALLALERKNCSDSFKIYRTARRSSSWSPVSWVALSIGMTCPLW
jgi:hypothetical protein